MEQSVHAAPQPAQLAVGEPAVVTELQAQISALKRRLDDARKSRPKKLVNLSWRRSWTRVVRMRLMKSIQSCLLRTARLLVAHRTKQRKPPWTKSFA
eukprot:5011346-Amphidinium_carterae.1